MKTTTTVKKSIPFKQCTLSYLDKQFELREIYDSKTLKKWMSFTQDIAISEVEQVMIEQWRQDLVRYVHDWNEQELSFHFIGQMFSLGRFLTDEFSLFAQRPISAIIGDMELTGKPDGLIAKGKRDPELPFFFA